MSEQPNPIQANTLATVLDGARYLDIAQAALGAVIMPDEVKHAVQAIVKPEGVTWEGSPVWLTAYYAGLREHVLARRASAGQGGSASDTEARSRNKMRITARLDVTNHVVTTQPDALPSAAWADAEGPRADFQLKYGNILRWAAVMPPARSEKLPIGERPIMDDAIVLPAPTGVGKTLLGGNYLAAAGIGQVGPSGKRKRALWITISQPLIVDVLNPEKTMQKTLPEGTTATAIWQDNKDASSADGDLVAVTVQSLEDALTAIEEGREPLINPEDFDILMFDEAHAGLSPRMTRLLAHFNCQKVLLTATPARSNYLSLLNRYHHVPPMGRREAIEEGLLSPVHIVSIMAENMPHAESQAALAAVEFFIKHGKKATIYCQPGGENAQAVRVAKLIEIYAEQIMGAAYNPKLVYAEMVGAANPKSRESVAAFEKQKHGGVRTTTDMLGVGWDLVELDGSIWIGSQSDFLALMQESGRSVRPKKDGRAAWWIHINTPIPEGSKGVYYGLPQTVGLEEVPSPDWEIGRPPDWVRPGSATPGGQGGGSQRPEQSPWRPGREPGTGSDDDTPGPTPPHGTPGEAGAPEAPGPDAPSPTPPDGEAILAGVSDELARSFIKPHTPLAEIIIEPGRRDRYIPPPEFSITDEELAARFDVPVSFIHYYLDVYPGAPDVSYKSLRTLRVPGLTDEARAYVRHYHAGEVEARLAARPIPRVSEAIYAVANIAKALHAPESAIYDIIKTLKLPDRPPTRARHVDGVRTGRPAPRYTLAEYKRISEQLATVPVADPQDQTWRSVLGQYPLGAKTLDLEFDRQRLRHPLTSDRKGVESFVLAARVREIAAEDERRRALVTAKEAADRAGVTLSVLQAGMNSEESTFFDDPRNRFAPLGGTKNSRHLTPAMSDALVERIGPDPLRYDEVTFEVIKARLADVSSDSALRSTIAPHAKSQEKRRIARLEHPVMVFGIEALRAAEARFGRKAGQPEINYGWFAAEAADPSDELMAYARTVQTDVLGVNPYHLAPDRTRAQRTALAQEAETPPAAAAEAAVIAPPAAPAQAEAPEQPAAQPSVVVEVAPEPASEPAPQPEPETEPAPQPVSPVTAPGRLSGEVLSLEEVAQLSGRSPGAVASGVRQLGLEDDARSGSVLLADGLQLVKLLTGGKKSVADADGVAGATGAPPAATTSAPPAEKAGETAEAAKVPSQATLKPGQEMDEQGVLWWNVGGEHGVLAELNCTPAAFAYLVGQDNKVKGARIRTTSDGRTQLSGALVASLAATIQRIRQHPPNTDMGMTHERLAENLGIEPETLVAYMRKWLVSPGQEDIVVRSNTQRRGLVELMYKENRWKRVMTTKGRK